MLYTYLDDSQVSNKQTDYRFETNTPYNFYFDINFIDISIFAFPAFLLFFDELMRGRIFNARLMNLCNTLDSSKLLTRADCRSHYPDCFPHYPCTKLLVVIFKMMLTGGMYLHLFLHFLLLLSALCLSIFFFSA